MNALTLDLGNKLETQQPRVSQSVPPNDKVNSVAKKKLCEIFDDNLESGLRGIPVGYCTTSSVDPYKGLFYVEKPISDLAFLSPEEVIYLLYKGEPGSKEDVGNFAKELHKRSQKETTVFGQVRSLPEYGKPLELFQMALQLYGMPTKISGINDYQNDCLQVIAIAPVLAAAVYNHINGEEIYPQRTTSSRGYIENFVDLIEPDLSEQNKSKLIEILRMFNILHLDHGGGNLSTFVGKSVASGLEDMYGSIAAALLALAGPRHGGANSDALKFVQEMMVRLGENPTEKDVENFVRSELLSGKVIPGFGHAVLRVEDPRASLLYDYSAKNFPNDTLIRLALMLRKLAPKVLKENPKISNPYPNVDAISGILLFAAGLKDPKMYPLLFGMSRAVGIAIQIVYERCEARNGKGTPIMRPKYVYLSRQKGVENDRMESTNG